MIPIRGPFTRPFGEPARVAGPDARHSLRRLLHRVWRPLWVALACMAGWPLVTLAARLAWGTDDFYGVPFALIAVVLAAWLGGLVAGLAVTLGSVALLAAVLPAVRELNVEAESAWHLFVFGLLAVLTDAFVSSQRRLKMRLEREVEYRDRFLEVASHELRTPLTIVYGGLRLLRSGRVDPASPEMDELVQSMAEEAEKLSQVTDDLLTLSRIEAHEPELAEAIWLQRPVSRAVEGFRTRRPDRPVSLTGLDPAERVRGDERTLSSVLRNLIENADHYSAGATPIEVSVTREGGNARVCVRDYGPGVDVDELETIFEPYYRSPALPDGSRGLGQGLTLCKRAVEAMGGRIWASLPHGGGLKVCFTLRIVEGGGRPEGALGREPLVQR